MKKLKKENIDMPDPEERTKSVSEIMEDILGSGIFQETFESLCQPITMLLPHEGKESFYLYSPTQQSFRLIKAPTEAIVIEESNGRETMCLIHNIPFMVPDEYLKNVGYN